jgi:RNA polymerase primary sigma factor
LLSAQEERALAERVALGDPHARDHMVKANLRLVVNLARGYLGKGLSLEDLIAEGNLGLLRAVEGYDGTRGVQFSTYASYWIKQSIRRAVINQGKPIRLPAHMVSLLSKWWRVSSELAERLGRAPTSDEVGAALRLSKKKQAMAVRAIEVNNLVIRQARLDVENLDCRNSLVDERSKPIDDILIEMDEGERIRERLAQLKDREAEVLRMRFGLRSDGPMTRGEVGTHLGMTRERVRQIEVQAIAKLREVG